MKIRLLKENETNRLHNIDESLNHKTISDLIITGTLKVVVIDYNNELIGCVFLEKIENYYYLYNLKILPKYQNKSLGQTMIKFVLKHINSNIYLKVEKANEVALYIYEKLGFTKEKEEIDYINGIKKSVYVLKYDRKKEITDENNITRR